MFRPKRLRAAPRFRLRLELLESRLTPATLIVDATHPFLSQLAAALPGATLQIEPGAVIGNVNSASGSLIGNIAAGETDILCTTDYVPGQIITIGTGAGVDTNMVDSATPVGASFSLTLGAPIVYSHSNGAAIAPVANAVGIDKGATITGDSTKAPSTLFSGTSIEFFQGATTPSPDVLGHLTLSTVSGTTSGNLSIVGDTISITSGSTAPVDVTAGGSLTISNDSISVGSAATVAAAVLGITNSGSIEFSADKVSAIGGVGFGDVFLFSTSGPISVSGSQLTNQGTDSGDGMDLSTSGDVAVTSTTVHLSHASTAVGLSISGAGCSLNGVQVATGSTLGTGISVASKSDITVAETTLMATGTVATGISLAASADVAVSELTATLEGGCSADGIDVNTPSAVSLNHVILDATGNVAGYGIYATGPSSNVGSLSLSNVAVDIQGIASYGLWAIATGTASVTGPVQVTATGGANQVGMFAGSIAGNLGVSAAVTVTLGAGGLDGLALVSQGGAVTVTAPLSLRVAGTLAEAGLTLEAGTNLTLGPTAVTLNGPATEGVIMQATGQTIAKSLSLKASAPLLGNAIAVAADGGVTISGLSESLAGGTADDALEVSTAAGAIDLAHPVLSLGGAVGGAGLDLTAMHGDINISDLNLQAASTLAAGIGAQSGGGLSVLGSSVTVAGNLGQDGMFLSAVAGLTMSTDQLTLKGSCQNAILATGGTVSATGLSLRAVGSISSGGIVIDSTLSNATITSSHFTFGSTSEFGVDADSVGDATIQDVTLSAAGPMEDGIVIQGQGNLSMTNDAVAAPQGISGVGLYGVSTGGDLTIDHDSFSTTTAAAGLGGVAIGTVKIENCHVSMSGAGAAPALYFPAGSGREVIENNAVSTAGQGIGLVVTAGATAVALIQGNNFEGNLIGVEIIGDGTSAGAIDLGGGSLGSKGGNNFEGFTGTGGHYAIVLSSTSAEATVYAFDDLFGVTNPVNVVQDGTHNSNGTGTGIIAV